MKKNSHVHLLLETEELKKLKKEAEKIDTNVNELIRRKLNNIPVKEEVLIIQELILLLKSRGKNG